MSRLRPAVAAVCLAVLLMAALPGAGLAQRSAERDSAIAQSSSLGNQFVGAALAWGQSALTWLQALIAAEHGTVVEAPVAPPPSLALLPSGGG